MPISSKRLAESYARSLAMPVAEQVSELSAMQFAGAFTGAAEWAIGPFAPVPGLAMRLEGQWPDPTGIGWRSGALLNPSLLPEGNHLHLFYRAAPRKETLDSRIGHAVLDPAIDAWQDSDRNPVVYPTEEDEAWGCEDPKIYRGPDGYYLFYNAAWPIDDRLRATAGTDLFSDEVGCDIKAAFSSDLLNWTKLGRVVPRTVSRSWAKAAVIPRDETGTAIAIGGEYLMFLSEGCGGALTVGRSRDLRAWSFEAIPYLDVSSQGALHEISTAFVLPDRRHFILDYFFEDAGGRYQAGQALYSIHQPFVQIAISNAGVLAWGGIVAWQGRWMFAQGWDAPTGVRELTFYASERRDGNNGISIP